MHHFQNTLIESSATEQAKLQGRSALGQHGYAYEYEPRVDSRPAGPTVAPSQYFGFIFDLFVSNEYK